MGFGIGQGAVAAAAFQLWRCAIKPDRNAVSIDLHLDGIAQGIGQAITLYCVFVSAIWGLAD